MQTEAGANKRQHRLRGATVRRWGPLTWIKNIASPPKPFPPPTPRWRRCHCSEIGGENRVNHVQPTEMCPKAPGSQVVHEKNTLQVRAAPSSRESLPASPCRPSLHGRSSTLGFQKEWDMPNILQNRKLDKEHLGTPIGPTDDGYCLLLNELRGRHVPGW